MSITLKLDTAAMEALFPAGSEARVELQRAVVANFIAAHIKPAMIGAQVEAMVKAAKEAAVKEALAELGITPAWGGATTLSESFKAKLKEQAGDSIRANISKVVDEAATDVLSKIDGRLKAAVDAKTDDEIRRVIRQRVEQLAAGLLKS
jgi:hypothetical protein